MRQLKLQYVLYIVILLCFSCLDCLAQDELKLRYTEIDSIQFSFYEQNYTNPLRLDASKNTVAGSAFSLSIKGEKVEFECGENYNPCNYYRGYLPAISCHVITNCGSSICGTYLINEITGDRNGLLGPFDNECEAPVLSKDLKKMLVISSNVFYTENYIVLYERKSTTVDFDFQSFKSVLSGDWKILEVVWIDDNSFAAMTYTEFGGETGDEPLNIEYFSIKII